MDVHPSARTAEDQPEPLRVVLDAGRFVRVEVGRLDETLRGPAALGAAFDRAYAAAVVADRPRASSDLVDAGVRPTGPRVLSGPPLPPAPAGPHWDLINHLADADGADRRHLRAEGSSDNECVRVRLDPASSRGRLVEIDPGWLRQTTTGRLAAAIGQAFADAYEKRGR